MTLKIEILEGPNAGKVYEFGDDTELVEIGRDAAHCQVLFPVDYTVVGRRHLAIRNVAGHYDLETNLTNPVSIDDREPFDGESLGQSHTLQLGLKGPTLKIETSLDGSLPVTDATPIARSASVRYELSARRQRWLSAALAIVAVAVLAGAGYEFWSAHNQRALIADLTQKFRSNDGAEIMPAELLQKISASTYLILIGGNDGAESPVGTAWSYGPGLLATNSHVADTFNELKIGQKLIARSTVAPYEALTIDRVALHPDYKRFTAAWEQLSPVRGNADAGAEQLQAPGAGYDVAVMHVTEPSKLQPALEIASNASLSTLKAGEVVGYAGFPMEGLAVGGINPRAPVPQVQIGHITAVSDYFLLPDKPAERFLIQHSAPATGGASGSPMIDKAGHVIGLVSGINIIAAANGNRAPNAASVNFAQRADLLGEVENGVSEAAASERNQSWKEGFATFDDPVVVIPRGLRKQWQDQNAATSSVEIFSSEGTLEAQESHGHAQLFKSVISKPGHYLVLAVSPAHLDIDLAVFRKSDLVDQDQGNSWFPYVILDSDKPDDLSVLVAAEGQDTPPDYKLMIWHIPPSPAETQ